MVLQDAEDPEQALANRPVVKQGRTVSACFNTSATGLPPLTFFLFVCFFLSFVRYFLLSSNHQITADPSALYTMQDEESEEEDAGPSYAQPRRNLQLY